MQKTFTLMPNCITVKHLVVSVTLVDRFTAHNPVNVGKEKKMSTQLVELLTLCGKLKRKCCLAVLCNLHSEFRHEIRRKANGN